MTAAFAANEFDPGTLLIAGGGHALVVADAVLAMGVKLGGFYDDKEDAPHARGEPSSRWLGTIESLSAKALVGRPWIVCLGDLGLRRRVIDRLYGAEEDARRGCWADQRRRRHAASAPIPSSETLAGAGITISRNGISSRFGPRNGTVPCEPLAF